MTTFHDENQAKRGIARHEPTRKRNQRAMSPKLIATRPGCSPRTHPLDDLPDLAVLIGLAFQHAEAGGFRPGSVPEAIMQPICLYGLFGDPTARLVVTYLNRRALATMKGKDGKIRLDLSHDQEIGGAAWNRS